MTTIIDLVELKGINKGTIKLVGFETDFFKPFKKENGKSLEQFSGLNSPSFKVEESHGNYRVVLTTVEPSLVGRYQLDVYDLRTNPKESTAPKNLRARETFEDSREATRLYEAIRRRLPYLD